MARRIGNNGGAITTGTFIDRCLFEMGLESVDEETYGQLVTQAELGGTIVYGENGEFEGFSERVADMLALIAGTKEYQFG